MRVGGLVMIEDDVCGWSTVCSASIAQQHVSARAFAYDLAPIAPQHDSAGAIGYSRECGGYAVAFPAVVFMSGCRSVDRCPNVFAKPCKPLHMQCSSCMSDQHVRLDIAWPAGCKCSFGRDDAVGVISAVWDRIRTGG